MVTAALRAHRPRTAAESMGIHPSDIRSPLRESPAELSRARAARSRLVSETAAKRQGGVDEVRDLL